MAPPSKYNKSYCEQVTKLCMLGAKDTELADFFGITEMTLNNWKKAHPEFHQAMHHGKDIADANVASKLYQRAMGYEHPDSHISNFQGAITVTPITKYYPPDTTACIFWLKNRQRAKWRDRTDHEVTGAEGKDLIPEAVDDLEIARRVAYVLSMATIDKASQSAKENSDA